MRTLAAATGAAALSLLAALPAWSAAMNLNQDFEARGANPAWTLTTSGNSFTLSRPGKPDVKGQAPGARIAPPKASWEVAIGQGGPMTVTFTFAQCAMGEARGPITAEVAVGGQVLKGCASPKTAASSGGR